MYHISVSNNKKVTEHQQAAAPNNEVRFKLLDYEPKSRIVFKIVAENNNSKGSAVVCECTTPGMDCSSVFLLLVEVFSFSYGCFVAE